MFVPPTKTVRISPSELFDGNHKASIFILLVLVMSACCFLSQFSDFQATAPLWDEGLGTLNEWAQADTSGQSSREEDIPIIQIFTERCPLFLKIQLWQAGRLNRRVILVGHKNCTSFALKYNVQFYDIEGYLTNAMDFGKIYFPSYSTNGEKWRLSRRWVEMRSFQRWFILSEFMKREHIGRAFYADGDTMIYTDVSKLDRDYYRSHDFVFMWAPPAASMTFAIVTSAALEDFLEFVKQEYRQWEAMPRMSEKHMHTIFNDGFSAKLYSIKSLRPADMDCLYMRPRPPRGADHCVKRIPFAIAALIDFMPRFKTASLAAVTGGVLFDHNLSHDPYHLFRHINCSVPHALEQCLEYEVIKEVSWMDGGVPYLHMATEADGQPMVAVRAAGLHFQMFKKPWMRYYMRDVGRACARPACTCVSGGCAECMPACDRLVMEQFIRDEEPESLVLELRSPWTGERRKMKHLDD